MPSSRDRQLRREKEQAQRRRAERSVEAQETHRRQEVAAARRDLARRARRHRAAYVLWVVAVVMAVSHFFEHANTIRLLSPGMEDLLIGWPMAAVLVLAGGIIYGR